MAEISLKLTLPAMRRAMTPYQRTGVVRAAGPDTGISGGFSWCLSPTDTPAFAEGMSWTIPGFSRARYWGGTPTQLTLNPLHGYMIFVVPGDPTLWFIEQENWAAVAAGQDVGKIAWVDGVLDLLPRLPQVALVPMTGCPVWVTNFLGGSISRFKADSTPIGTPITGLLGPDPLCRVGDQIWVGCNSGTTSDVLKRYLTDGTPVVPDSTAPNLAAVLSLTVVGSQVWVTSGRTSPAVPFSVIRFQFDGTYIDSLTPSGLSSPADILQVGSQVWVGNVSDVAGSITRFNLDGTVTLSPLTGNNLFANQSMRIVGTEVWVLGQNVISRFNFNGTVPGPPLLTNIGSFGMIVVGTQVWVGSGPDTDYGTIRRFNFDGSNTLPDLLANGDFTAPRDFTFHGTDEVWGVFNSGGDSGNTILRYKRDGTRVLPDFPNGGMDYPQSILEVCPPTILAGVWVSDTTAGHIATFALDGTPGPVVTHPDLGVGAGIAMVGSQIWAVQRDTNKIVRLNRDGSQAAPSISDAYLGTPVGIAVVGSQVWVTNQSSPYPSGTNTNISIYNLDGSSAGTPIAGHPTGGAIDQYAGLATLGTEVWVACEQTEIVRLDLTGALIDHFVPFADPRDVLVVTPGSAIWVSGFADNRIGFYGPTGSLLGQVSRASTDFCGLALVGGTIWAADQINALIHRYLASGASAGADLSAPTIVAPAYLAVIR